MSISPVYLGSQPGASGIEEDDADRSLPGISGAEEDDGSLSSFSGAEEDDADGSLPGTSGTWAHQMSHKSCTVSLALILTGISVKVVYLTTALPSKVSFRSAGLMEPLSARERTWARTMQVSP